MHMGALSELATNPTVEGAHYRIISPDHGESIHSTREPVQKLPAKKPSFILFERRCDQNVHWQVVFSFHRVHDLQKNSNDSHFVTSTLPQQHTCNNSSQSFSVSPFK